MRLFIAILCVVGFGALLALDTPGNTPNTDPPAAPVPPPEAAQVFVWFIPSDCNAPCGTHWVYLLWRDGGLWRRLCDADGCGGWEAL